MLGAVPAQGGGAAHGALVGLAGQHGVHDEGLQAGVPGTACLGGLRVDLGGGEGDLPRVHQQRLAQHGLVARRRDLVDRGLHDLDRGAHHLDGLAQRDRSGQLARRGAEDVGGDRLRGVGAAEPLGEGGDSGLGDEADPGTVLRRHRPVPGQRLVHPRDGLRGETSRRLLQAFQGRCVVVDGARRGIGGTDFGFGHGDKSASSGQVRGAPGPARGRRPVRVAGLRWEA